MPEKLRSSSRFWGALFVVIALLGFQWMSIGGGALLCAAFALVATIIGLIAWRAGDHIATIMSGSGAFLPHLPISIWMSLIVVLGIALRVCVWIAFPAEQTSDAAIYAHLAQELASGRPYVAAEGRAFWPPGLPLFFAPLLVLFGKYAIIVYNLITFVLAELPVFALARRFGGATAACIAAFFIAVWPNLVFSAPLLQKELLMVALWPAAIWLYLRAHENIRTMQGFVWALAAGVMAGYSALIQPSGILLPICFVLFSCFEMGLRRRAFVLLSAAAVGAMLTIAPWMARNYAVLHKLVPITSGGGVNFYMVQHPDSDGRWSREGVEAAMAVGGGEIERNDRGFALGVKLIINNPSHLLSTMLKRPFYIFGHDDKSMYWVFERGRTGTALQYSIFTALADGFYLSMLLLAAVYFIRRGYEPVGLPGTGLVLMFMYYPIFAHSVFEASERHGYGALGLLALFAALACRPPMEAPRLASTLRPVVAIRSAT